jgi:hypothetical protein
MSKIQDIINGIIDPMVDEQGEYFKNSQNVDEVSFAIGYNQALTDLRSNLPEIEKAIVEEIENIHKKHYMVWTPTREQIGYRKAQMDIIKHLTS